ncbi:MAG: PHP domain-containing protein [Bacteroidales bacterium]
MKLYKADLHIHTVLSPCGDLEMSPANIVNRAKEKGLEIIGITDHNNTKNCKVIEEIAAKEGILVLKGAEVTTKEEVHCLAFFEKDNELNEFQNYLDSFITKIKNDPEKFGYQVVVDKNENIVEQIDWLLISALDQNIQQVERKVHQLNGLFIPAHIDRARYSLISQLGFVPADLNEDALELSKHIAKSSFIDQNKYLADRCFIRNSDSHFTENIGDCSTIFQMNEKTFSEVRMALKSENGRKVIAQ